MGSEYLGQLNNNNMPVYNDIMANYYVNKGEMPNQSEPLGLGGMLLFPAAIETYKAHNTFSKYFMNSSETGFFDKSKNAYTSMANDRKNAINVLKKMQGNVYQNGNLWDKFNIAQEYEQTLGSMRVCSNKLTRAEYRIKNLEKSIVEMEKNGGQYKNQAAEYRKSLDLYKKNLECLKTKYSDILNAVKEAKNPQEAKEILRANRELIDQVTSLAKSKASTPLSAAKRGRRVFYNKVVGKDLTLKAADVTSKVAEIGTTTVTNTTKTGFLKGIGKSVFKSAGKMNVVLSVGMEAVCEVGTVKDAFKIDKKTGWKQVSKSTLRAGISGACWAGGAAAGAAIGAAVGSAVPLVGTAIGLIAGAAIGAVSSWVAKKGIDAVWKDPAKKAKKKQAKELSAQMNNDINTKVAVAQAVQADSAQKIQNNMANDTTASAYKAATSTLQEIETEIQAQQQAQQPQQTSNLNQYPVYEDQIVENSFNPNASSLYNNANQITNPQPIVITPETFSVYNAIANGTFKPTTGFPQNNINSDLLSAFGFATQHTTPTNNQFGYINPILA